MPGAEQKKHECPESCRNGGFRAFLKQCEVYILWLDLRIVKS